MNTTRTVIIATCLSALLSITISWGYSRYSTNKIGYIKTAIILRDYKGMIASTEQFNKELKVVQTNLDTLRNRYEILEAKEHKLSNAKEKEECSYLLGVAQTEYEKYDQQASQQMQARKDELTRKELETVNSFINDFGKKNNYKLILGTTNDGSILYGREADDLTETLLTLLNESFHPGDAPEKEKK